MIDRGQVTIAEVMVILQFVGTPGAGISIERPPGLMLGRSSDASFFFSIRDIMRVLFPLCLVGCIIAEINRLSV